MAKCPLCGKEVPSDDLKFQFYDNEGSEHYVCSKCENALDSLTENNENSDEALNYINKYSSNCTDEELRVWLNDVVDSYTENSEEYAEDDSSASSDTTFWISSLRGVYKFVFFVIIIIGIVLCAMLCSNDYIGIGIIALAVSILIAVMVVGFAIVFLDLARDIHRIRNILEEQSNDKE